MDESIKQAAMRETMEEAGVLGILQVDCCCNCSSLLILYIYIFPHKKTGFKVKLKERLPFPSSVM